MKISISDTEGTLLDTVVVPWTLSEPVVRASVRIENDGTIALTLSTEEEDA